jgi:hypothetical protein
MPKLVLSFAYLNICACLNEHLHEMHWDLSLDNSRVCLGCFDVHQCGKGGEYGERVGLKQSNSTCAIWAAMIFIQMSTSTHLT